MVDWNFFKKPSQFFFFEHGLCYEKRDKKLCSLDVFWVSALELIKQGMNIWEVKCHAGLDHLRT